MIQTSKTAQKIFYVYQLRIDGQPNPFYVGKGHADRCYIHFEENSLRAKSRKNHTIKKALREGREIFVELLSENLAEADAFQLEMDSIALYGKLVDGSGCLTNLTDGGDGPSGYRHSPAARARMSESHLGKKKGPHSAKTREKMSDSHAGKTLSEAHRQALSLAHRGRKHTEEHVRRRSQARQLPEHTLAVRIALHNPLLVLEEPHVKPQHSRVRCGHCGGTVVAKNTYLAKGQLPKEHYQCAVAAFRIDQGTGVYRTRNPYDGHQHIRVPDPGVPFTFKLARAGVAFFDLDGAELDRVPLPRSYVESRMHASLPYLAI